AAMQSSGSNPNSWPSSGRFRRMAENGPTRSTSTSCSARGGGAKNLWEEMTDGTCQRLPPPDDVYRQRSGGFRLLHQGTRASFCEADRVVRRCPACLSPLLRLSRRGRVDHHHDLSLPQARHLRPT